MKCPYCKNVVCAEKTYGTQWVKNTYYDDVEGTCPNCGKSWCWTEVYTFDHIENVEELKR